MPTSEEAVAELVELVELRQRESPGRIRVAVDGRDGAGKTTLADRRAMVLEDHGAEVHRADIDDWQFLAAVRYE